VSTYSLGTGRTNESNGINKKEALCIWSQVLLKSSASEVMTSSEASSSEAPHQKQNHQKMKESKLQRLFKGFNHT